MFAGIPVTRRMGLVGFARAVSSLVPLSWHQMRNRMRSQPGEGRQCVRHARYRQYQPDSFLFPLSGAPGDKTPDHPRRYRLHRFTTIHPRTIIPRYDPSFYHYVHATSPFLFFAACACRTTFDEPPLRLHRCLLPRLCSSSMDFLSFFFSFCFVSSSFWIYRCLLRYSFFFFFGCLKKISFTWNVIDYVPWIYCDLVFKYDFWLE